MEEEPKYKYLNLLDDEILPQYSDALLVLSQYEADLKAFKEKYFGFDSARAKYRWILNDGINNIEVFFYNSSIMIQS